MKNVLSTVPTTFSHGVNATTSTSEIADVFNNYFVSVPETAKQNINCSHKTFLNTYKINAIYSGEIANIISSLNINKACGPFSIPKKILILLKQDISTQLSNLFNFSFPLALFHLYLKLQR